MAADHRRKRLNGASLAGCSSWEQYKTKKKKLESPKIEFNPSSHISLEWNGNLKKVVAKKEQIGLRRKDLRAFNYPSSQHRGFLGDVLSVPQEIFEIENLMEVLSPEVWQTHLSENERKYLSQFLPGELDTEDTVQALLSGDNFHFGNPFLKWSTSLCSGNLHPDALIHQGQRIKAELKTYYSEIEKYHTDMVNYLQKLKEMCETSQDPIDEVMQRISRSSKDVEHQMSSHTNELDLRDLEDDAATTSESCSFIAEDKAFNPDYQDSSLMRGGESQRRDNEKGLTKGKSKKKLPQLHDGRPKREQLHKHKIHLNDDDKYMSYLKISKKQHQLVKSMKHSGKSIQSKSLNQVLGNLDTLHVQPYGEFVKEEHKKLHEHWLHLAKFDLPAAYENWRVSKSQRMENMKSLDRELKSKVEILMEGEEISDEENVSQDQHGATKPEVEDGERANCVSELQYRNDQGEGEGESDEDEEKENHHTVLIQDQNDGPGNGGSFLVDDDGTGSGSPNHQSPQQISSPSAGHEINPVDIDRESNHVASKPYEDSPNISRFSENTNIADASMAQGGPIPSGGDLWPEIGMAHSFYGSAANHDYASAAQLSLPHSVDNAQHNRFIDLESNALREDSAKNFLERQPNDGSFSSHPNHDRSGLLQSLFKGQDMVSFQHEQKQMGQDFQPHNMLTQNGHFTGNLHQQLHATHPLEQAQRRLGENFIQHSLPGDIYSEESRFLVSRQGHVPPSNGLVPHVNGHLQPLNLQDWPVNAARMPAQLPAYLNNEVLLTQNWYPGEHNVRGGWNSADSVSAQGQSIGSNTTDQGLYSVLSQCNQLRSNNNFDTMPTENFMLPRSYGMTSGVRMGNTNSIPQATHPLDYLSGRNSTGPLMPDDMGWMNLPQNSSLHDQVGKPYLRSWNQ